MLAAPGGQPAVSRTRIPAGTRVHPHLCFPSLSREQLWSNWPVVLLVSRWRVSRQSTEFCAVAMPVASTGEHHGSLRCHVFLLLPALLCSIKRRGE